MTNRSFSSSASGEICSVITALDEEVTTVCSAWQLTADDEQLCFATARNFRTNLALFAPSPMAVAAG